MACSSHLLRPRISAFGLADTDEDHLIPKEPLTVALSSENDLAGVIRAAASNE